MADPSIYNEFYLLLCEISYGLKSKELTYQKQLNRKDTLDMQYIKDQYLIRAINKLYAFALRNNITDSNGNILAPRDETDAIVNYFSRNISEWIDDWNDKLKEALEPIYGMEPLIQLRGGNKYLCNESCFELALQCTLYDQDAEQRKLFTVLRGLEQEAYVYSRKYIISHPLIDSLDLNEFQHKLKDLDVDERKINKIIAYAYEPIPDDALYKCSCCGWTISKGSDGSLYCIDSRCKRNTDNYKNVEQLGDTRNLKRLKPGVMRYMAIPGKLELCIENHCLSNGIRYELWPNKDAYDVKVYINNKYILAIDAKDYKNAFILSKKILDEGNLFAVDDWNEGYIVIPDEAANIKVDYCEVVNKALRRKFGTNVSCIKFSDLIKIISEVHKI